MKAFAVVIYSWSFLFYRNTTIGNCQRKWRIHWEQCPTSSCVTLPPVSPNSSPTRTMPWCAANRSGFFINTITWRRAELYIAKKRFCFCEKIYVSCWKNFHNRHSRFQDVFLLSYYWCIFLMYSNFALFQFFVLIFCCRLGILLPCHFHLNFWILHIFCDSFPFFEFCTDWGRFSFLNNLVCNHIVKRAHFVFCVSSLSKPLRRFSFGLCCTFLSYSSWQCIAQVFAKWHYTHFFKRNFIKSLLHV